MESDGTRHRKPWFDCSCCPTQLARFIPAVGSYFYAAAADTIWVNQYAQSDATLTVAGASVWIAQRTRYPGEGQVTLEIEPGREPRFTLALRIPSWSPTVGVTLNGKPLPGGGQDRDGYVRIARIWQSGDRIELSLSMDVRREYADPRVKADAGRVALRRGPLVYCFEECDNPGGLARLHVSRDARFNVREAVGLPEGTRSIEVVNPDGSRFTAVPYFAWDNRAPGAMRVWPRETSGGEA
jgi:hypothetical protein